MKETSDPPKSSREIWWVHVCERVLQKHSGATNRGNAVWLWVGRMRKKKECVCVQCERKTCAKSVRAKCVRCGAIRYNFGTVAYICDSWLVRVLFNDKWHAFDSVFSSNHSGLLKNPALDEYTPRPNVLISRRPSFWSGNGNANTVYQREGIFGLVLSLLLLLLFVLLVLFRLLLVDAFTKRRSPLYVCFEWFAEVVALDVLRWWHELVLQCWWFGLGLIDWLIGHLFYVVYQMTFSGFSCCCCCFFK